MPNTSHNIPESQVQTADGHLGNAHDDRLFSYVSNGENRLTKAVIDATERLAGRRYLRAIYKDFNHRLAMNHDHSFWQTGLDALGVTTDIRTLSAQTLPPNKPIVVIANHPYGLIDSLAICQWMSQHRQEFKILLNENLCRDERIAAHTLPVDFANNREAKKRTIRSKQAALTELSNNGAVIIFPAGGVSTTPRWYRREADDLPWKPFAAKLIQRSQATIVPLYFHGQNSRLFQWCSHISLPLRLGLYVREIRRARGKTLMGMVGNAIPYDELPPWRDDTQLMTLALRRIVYDLAKPLTSEINQQSA